MISIILAGRNDNYGGNFEERLFSTLEHNTAKLDRANIDYEIIFVEWNPIAELSLLSLKVVGKHPQIRCYVVSPEIHQFLSENRNIHLYEYHAKNIGARFALGNRLLITNPDDYFGEDIIRFLAAGKFDDRTLYRAGWVNISNPADIDNPRLKDRWRFDLPPFAISSGDFIFCSKKLFERVGGFHEEIRFTNTHLDSLFCYSAFGLTWRVRKIGRVYHLDHGRDQHSKRRLDYNILKIPRRTRKTCASEEISELSTAQERIFELKIKPDLLDTVRGKVIPEGTVPRQYRMSPAMAFLLKTKARFFDFLDKLF